MHISNPFPLTTFPKHNSQSGQSIWFRTDAHAHLDFVNDRAFVDGVVYTGDSIYSDFVSDQRTTNAWAVDKKGVLNSYTGSQLRKTKSGLWVNNVNTHNIKNSSGAGASAPSTFPTGWTYSAGNGVALTVVGTGTDAETQYPYVEMRLSGTATGTTGPALRFTAANNEIAAAPSEDWVSSIFYKGISGNYDEITSIFLQNQAYDVSSNALTAGNGAVSVLHDYWERHAIRFTSPASTAFMVSRLKFNIVNGVTYDFVFRVALPLLGKFNNLAGTGLNGGYSPNLWEGPAPAVSSGTAVGAVARDDVRVAGAALSGLSADTGTWIMKFLTPNNSLEATKAVFDIRSAGGERRFIEATLSSGNLNYRTTGTTYGSANKILTTAFTSGENVAVGWSFDGATNLIASHSVSQGYKSDATGTMRQADSARSTAYIGNSGGLVSLNGYIQELIFFNEALTATQLQELTLASGS